MGSHLPDEAGAPRCPTEVGRELLDIVSLQRGAVSRNALDWPDLSGRVEGLGD